MSKIVPDNMQAISPRQTTSWVGSNCVIAIFVTGNVKLKINTPTKLQKRPAPTVVDLLENEFAKDTYLFIRSKCIH